MLNSNNEAAIENFEALIPDKWPTLEYPPWLEVRRNGYSGNLSKVSNTGI